MMRRMVIVLAAVTALVWGGLLLLGVSSLQAPAPLPTYFVLPSLTASPSATPTWTATPTLTPSATASLTATVTPSATLIPTLSTRVLEIVAYQPGVIVSPSATAVPQNVVVLSMPPEPLEPLPDATRSAPPHYGWVSVESDHPVVRYATPWQRRQSVEASRGQYHRTEDPSSSVYVPFEGEAFRVRYVAARNMGRFDIVVDGVTLDTIDAYSLELHFPASPIYRVSSGTHVLELRPTGSKHTQSEGLTVGFDALQVYRSDPDTLMLPPTPDVPTITPETYPVTVKLIAAPPTPRPTVTVPAPQSITASVVIAYDENGSKAVDPAEGVAGIPVRVVEIGTNRVLGSTLTDASGYAELRFITTQPVRLVAPYFGKSWPVPAGRTAVHRFTLLLVPGNQPGLIP